MREIKFRAWHTSSKEMIYEDEDAPGEVFYWKHEGQPIEIMQFTGLKDKNCVEIYEGDIVRWPHLSISGGEVYFNTDEACFAVRHRQHDDESWLDKGCEVIGNIYENLELLREE